MTNSAETIAGYRAAVSDVVMHERRGRALIEVTGDDRAPWLNNLVTNIVKTLAPGEGNYAFAVNVRGRTVFDVDILVLANRIWLDLEDRRVAAARKHLERYIITEKVALADRSADFARLALAGPRAREVWNKIGWNSCVAMAQLQHSIIHLDEIEARLVRNDFCGLPGWELFVPRASRDAAREWLSRSIGMLDGRSIEVSTEVVRILRMESGIPASVDDIDDEVLPPETGQVERGISYHKGCYLGQEVIERMRSHGVLVRKLVGLRIEGNLAPEPGALVATIGDASPAGTTSVGRITSACHSEAIGAMLALGYVKAAQANPGTRLAIMTAGTPLRAEVVRLPLRE